MVALALGPAAHASPHFAGCAAQTGVSATALVAADRVDALLDPGDEVAVHTPAGVCAGSAVWQGDGLAIAIWQDDEFTPEVDGFAEGEPLVFVVWDASAGVERTGLVAAYDEGYDTSGAFRPDAIYLVAGLAPPTDIPDTPAEGVFALGSNYPNPFRDRTTATYDLPSAAHVTVEVYNALGQRVAVLADERKAAGRYTAPFDARALAAGTYFLRMRADAFEATRSMLVTR